jgi:hypothetical protein
MTIRYEIRGSEPWSPMEKLQVFDLSVHMAGNTGIACGYDRVGDSVVRGENVG